MQTKLVIGILIVVILALGSTAVWLAVLDDRTPVENEPQFRDPFPASDPAADRLNEPTSEGHPSTGSEPSPVSEGHPADERETTPPPTTPPTDPNPPPSDPVFTGGEPSENQRYLSFNIWSFLGENGADDITVFKELVDDAKQKGFNTISLSFGWSQVESSQNQFQFAWVDERVDYIVEQGLKVQLRVSYQLSPEWIDNKYFMKLEDGSTFVKNGVKIPVIADSQVRAWMEQFLVKTVEQYQNRYASNSIIFYSIPITPDAESEYAYMRFSDYSSQAQSDFQQWLQQNKYSDINSLNQRWGTSYGSFSQVAIPKSIQYASPSWADWINYRTFALKRLFDQMAKAVRDTDPNAQIGLQFGSIWQNGAGTRGTYDAAKLVENADWVIVDDAPSWNHKFSMDLLRTIAKGKRIGNEIGFSGPGQATKSLGPMDSMLAHGQETFGYGGDILNFANWEVVFSFLTNEAVSGELKNYLDKAKDMGYQEGVRHINQPFWTSAFSLLGKEVQKPVTLIKEPKVALYVSTMAQYLYPTQDQFRFGVNTYVMVKNTYQMLTNGETKPIAIITDSVFADNPSVLNQYTDGIYIPSFNQIIADDAYAALSKAKVLLYAQDNNVGTKNEYGDARTPNIFTSYSTAAS